MKKNWVYAGIFFGVFIFGSIIGSSVMNASEGNKLAELFSSLQNGVSGIAEEIFGSEKVVDEVLVVDGEKEIIPLKNCDNETRAKSDYFQKIIFNEIAWMGTTEGSSYEWFEIKNKTNESVDMGGWVITDKTSAIKILIPNGTVLESGKFMLYGREVNGKISGDAGAIGYKNVIGNSNESLILRDVSCGTVDEVIANPSWQAGDAKARKTMERRNDLTWQTSSVVNGTPGKENSVGIFIPKKSETIKSISGEMKILADTQIDKKLSGTVSDNSKVFISEVMPGKIDNAYYEFIEIKNGGDVEVSLDGWSLKKRSGSGTVGTLVSKDRMTGIVVPKNGCILFGNGKGLGSTTFPYTAWPASYSLSYENNAVILVDDTGKERDIASWIEIEKGQSMSREKADNTWVFGFPSPCL